jgi:hypothetical protein
MSIFLGAIKNEKGMYRIRKENGKFKNAGTGKDSFFTLDKARKIVNYEKGEIIVESDGVNILWEVL